MLSGCDSQRSFACTELKRAGLAGRWEAPRIADVVGDEGYFQEGASVLLSFPCLSHGVLFLCFPESEPVLPEPVASLINSARFPLSLALLSLCSHSVWALSGESWVPMPLGFPCREEHSSAPRALVLVPGGQRGSQTHLCCFNLLLLPGERDYLDVRKAHRVVTTWICSWEPIVTKAEKSQGCL